MDPALMESRLRTVGLIGQKGSHNSNLAGPAARGRLLERNSVWNESRQVSPADALPCARLP
jgi:hypothetical protein